MIKIIFIIFFVILQSCSKPKTVLICGDHVCVNNKEAKQYFEENLTLEVKIVDNKKNENFDLVELNLKENLEKKKEINIVKKDKTREKIKTLSSKEIKEIKKNIKKKKKDEKIEKKEVKINQRKSEVSTKKKILKKDKKIVNKNTNSIDVCTILDKCSIDEISKYLIKNVKKKNFPDITIRE